jgi:hypothetical protein
MSSTGGNKMSEHNTVHALSHQWIDRCAQRLLRHRIVTPEEAADLAHELLASVGAEACPERAADDVFRMPAEV